MNISVISSTISSLDENLAQVEAKSSDGCTITFNRNDVGKGVKVHTPQVVIESKDFIDDLKNSYFFVLVSSL
ncbi:hypothetical protein ACPUVO_12615 [Pseudocolwellia sp. HL-MZ19]|uniref:hypothetical protein n=1 Tax=unclassified Pseudocolwellia TaxID=2848178 RepID=UPI003CF7F726